jgi:hypothetical protein
MWQLLQSRLTRVSNDVERELVPAKSLAAIEIVGIKRSVEGDMDSAEVARVSRYFVAQ